MEEVKLGMLGSGFVANFYMEGLSNVPGQEVILNTSRSLENAEKFASKWGIREPMDDMDKAIARDDVDLFVIALPNALHEDVAVKLADAERNMVCTKPLGRNKEEAATMLKAVENANVFHGYAETEVFAPAVVKAKEMIDAGALGDVTWVRSREAHPGPHEEHFWDADLTGGGALMDMGGHCVEAARYFFGKDDRITEVFAWGDTLVHTDRTEGEDNAILLLRFESGGIASIETSWSSSGGLDLRNEIYGTAGKTFTDVTGSTPMEAFTTQGGGYILEKAQSKTGWVFPLPEEAFAYGYQAEMKHFVDSLRKREAPRETFEDGFVDNAILESAYESMEKRKWIEVEY